MKKTLKIYENKISLMEEQIESLKFNLDKKVKMDKRKIQFAKEHLSKIDERFVGRIEDLPGFPSASESERNSLGKN